MQIDSCGYLLRLQVFDNKVWHLWDIYIELLGWGRVNVKVTFFSC